MTEGHRHCGHWAFVRKDFSKHCLQNAIWHCLHSKGSRKTCGNSRDKAKVSNAHHPQTHINTK
eukprot:3646217-Amphidinium_carterae.1